MNLNNDYSPTPAERPLNILGADRKTVGILTSTTLAVAHLLRSDEYCCKIVVLRDGRLLDELQQAIPCRRRKSTEQCDAFMVMRAGKLAVKPPQ